MKNIDKITFHSGSKEELLPGFAPDFPYIASFVDLNKYIGSYVPWHWHKEVEIFYMESGSVEYYTPKEKIIFPAGSGGLINSNILHMTKAHSQTSENIQLVQLFDPAFIAGLQGSRIEQKYITPIIADPQLEIIPVYPDNPEQTQLLKAIHDSFYISPNNFGYEINLRTALSHIWIQLLNSALPILNKKGNYDKTNDKIKLMMIYIHEHYPQKLSIAQIAEAAFCSERECFRAFHDCLHMTPVDYIKSYRIQKACALLTKTGETITSISQSCGLGSSSYFGKVFREHTGFSPAEYRRKWQNNDISRQK